MVGIGMSLTNLRACHRRYSSIVMIRGVVFATMLVTSLDFLRTMYVPINQSIEKLSSIEHDNVSSWTTNDWLALLDTDRLDPELPSQVANHAVQVLAERGRSMSAKEKDRWESLFDQAKKEYIRRDFKNWMPLLDAGRWSVLLAEKYADPRVPEQKKFWIEQTDRYYEAAADLYPNSISVQLQAAVGAAWAKKHDSAKKFMAKVTEIDSKTKHKDRKIIRATVLFPPTMETPESPLAENARVSQQPMMVRGEPVMAWLRTNVP